MSVKEQKRSDALKERIRVFGGDLADAHRRMGMYADTSAEPDVETFRAALAELQAHHEELRTADEELRSQVEELARMATKRDAERARYRELFDFAPDPYFVTNLWGLVLDANVAACELLHMQHAFLRGKPLATVIERDDVARFREVLGLSQSTQRVEVEVDLRGRRGDALAVTLVGAQSDDGNRILWTARPKPKADIDRAVPAASTPEAQIEALSHALREREDQLAVERRLRKELEASNRAKDHFLAVLSHDLRQPLNAVLGWTQILRRDNIDELGRERALATIERNTLAQAALVSELVDISRLGSDKIVLDLRPQDLGELGRRAIETVKPSADKKRLRLLLDLAPDALVVMADRARLDQVVSNLLSNAIKFTPTGGEVKLTVRRAGAWVELEVADNGNGVEPADLPTIFECFRQAERLPGQAQGLGLGLYIVKQLVELHGGRVKAESPGRDLGTTLTVRLPARDGAEIFDDEEALGDPEEVQGKSVLLVEDDPDTRELLTKVLANHGARVTAVGSGLVAMDAFASAVPDVIVSDIGMPGMDGYALITRLRTELGCSGPALALTAFAGPHDAQRAIMAGFDAHVSKPVDPYSVVTAVAALLRSRRPD